MLGVAWFEGMYKPGKGGYIFPTGKQVGGHCILCKGVNIRNRTFRLHNSWGPKWGKQGDCFMTIDDMAFLLSKGGEAVVFVGRKGGK